MSVTAGTILRALLPLSLASGLAGAEPWGLETLAHGLAAGDHPPLRYTETRESAFLQVPLVSHGTLRVLPDGALVKEKHVPLFERITIGEDRIDLESAGGAKRSFALSELPGLEGFASGLSALFTGDPEALRARFATELSGGPDHWRLSLTPVDRQLAAAVRYILLTGGAETVRRIRIVEGDGDSTLLELEAVPQ